MTIRLRCAECHRKLKVPDAALGKKVQCPVCGARFRGRVEESPSPAPPPSPEEISSLDAVFADMASSAPEHAVSSTIPDLELDGTPAAAEASEFEPLDEIEGMEEPLIVDEAVEEEAVEVTDDLQDLDAVDVMDEIGDEQEIAEEAEVEEEEQRPKKKKKSNLLLVILIAIVLVLGCGALAFFGYSYFFGSPSDTRPVQPVPPVPRKNPRVAPPPAAPPPGQR